MTVFGSVYADAYDALYREKDYDAEVDLLEAVFAAHASKPRRLFNIGCGTGEHARRLAARGYEVVGVDRSDAMLTLARSKDAPGVRWVESDLTTLDLGDETFDAAVCMFAVLGYITEDDALGEVLRRVARHVRPGGLFFFDCWFGPGVLLDRPGDRAREVDDDRGRVVRRATAELDLHAQVCSVRYDVEVGDRADQETHKMRFFFPREIALLLDRAGFDLERLGGFPGWSAPASEESWTACVVARRRR